MKTIQFTKPILIKKNGKINQTITKIYNQFYFKIIKLIIFAKDYCLTERC